MEITRRRLMNETKKLLQSDSNGIDYDVFSHETPGEWTAVVYGPNDSCFESCILLFKITCPPNYPHEPPVFKFITPICKRFHPNLYAEGKVCLTVLNTWHDSGSLKWSSTMTISSILITIRSMLHNNPLSEEPGQGSHKPDSDPVINYAIASKYYSLLNTFSYFMSDYIIPNDLKIKMKAYFLKNIAVYEKTINELEKYKNSPIHYFHGDVIIDSDELKKQLARIIAQ